MPTQWEALANEHILGIAPNHHASRGATTGTRSNAIDERPARDRHRVRAPVWGLVLGVQAPTRMDPLEILGVARSTRFVRRRQKRLPHAFTPGVESVACVGPSRRSSPWLPSC